MKTYGANIHFSTVNAPQPISGICENFTMKTADSVFRIQGEDQLAGLVIHGAKTELSFSSTPPGTVATMGVRAAAELTISGLTGGKILVTRAEARWQRRQPLVMSASSNHYPVLGNGTGSINAATMTFSGEEGPLVLPTDKVWFGTRGLSAPVAGIINSVSIVETVQVLEEEDGTGGIVGVVLYGYEATCSMEVLTSVGMPDQASVMSPFEGLDFQVLNPETLWTKGQQRAVRLEGLLVPGVIPEAA
jgi:hypothetical protein